MVGIEYFHKIITKYGLEPATKRGLPLFTFDCIVSSYNKPLKRLLGFTYGKAMAAIGGKNKFYAMLNESYIAAKMGEFLEKNFNYLDKKIFSLTDKIFDTTKQQIKIIDKIIHSQPKHCLKVITEIYPKYFLGVALYNCFWRYLGEESSKGKLSSSLVKRIGIKRNKFTKLYPEIEKKLQLCISSISRESDFDGDLLRYSTLDEMKSYLKTGKLAKSLLKKLVQRRRGYFYLFVAKTGQKYILTDKKIIKKIKNKFFKISKTASSFKGHTAYPGLVRGLVYNLDNPRISQSKIKFILVASMTHPKDTALIAESAAIVTNEGGILSHAAIISRELKKPCIIGTKIATKVLKDGDKIEVDANKGVVQIIKRK